MSQSNKATVGFFGVLFFVLSGMIGIDILSPTASMGPSVFGWWILVFVFFVIPYSLIVSELSTAYPGDGGVYDWTYQAFGSKWAARCGWYYWINVPFWMPAMYMLVVGVFAELVFPEMSTRMIIVFSIICVWLTVWLCSMSQKHLNILNIIGGISKALIVGVMIVAGIIFSRRNGMANEISVATIMPSFKDALNYAPTLIYSLIGAETVACLSASVKRPKRDLPLGLLVGILAIMFLYFGAVYAFQAAIPVEDLGLIAGIMQTFRVLFGSGPLSNLLTILMGIITILGLFTYLIPWTQASSCAACEAAQAGEMPAVFARKNKHDSPVGANVQTGIWATVALIAYGFMAGSADDLFWSLFAFSNILYFITYLMFLGAFVKLRVSEPETPRPFRVPRGMGTAVTMALIPCVCIAVGILLFYFPEIFSGSIDWSYSAPVLIGSILAILAVEIDINRKKKAATAAVVSE